LAYTCNDKNYLRGSSQHIITARRKA